MTPRIARRKHDPIGEKIAGLPTQELDALVTALRFNTRLEQSTLAKALKEQRKRRRAAKVGAPCAT